MGCLVLLSLILITMLFRSGEDGPLSGVQSAGATVLRPFAVGFERIAQPFRDVYEWAESLRDARSEAERLRIETVSSASARSERVRPSGERVPPRLQDFIDGPRFPDDFEPVSAEVIGRPVGAFVQAIVIAAGSRNGVRVNDSVVTADGLVGLVTRVTPSTAVSSS